MKLEWSSNAGYGVAIAALLGLTSCGGGGGGGGTAVVVTPPPPPVVVPTDGTIRISAGSPFTASCAEPASNGTVYPNAEVEPYIAVNPTNTSNLIAVWQQDRWSNGSSQGVVSGYSNDGGLTWTTTTVPFSICSGGNVANSGDYLRATDPWVTFSPNGVAYQMALTTAGGTFVSGSKNAMQVARSVDGGRTWGSPVTLIRDGETAFNDKNSITADARSSNFVYAVWDRLGAQGGGAAYLARTINGGASWETARNIYDPGPNSQTINNIAVSLPSGLLINFFTQIDSVGSANTATLNVIRSTDNGITWGPRIRIGDVLSVGTRDPDSTMRVRDGSQLGSIAVGPNGDLHVVWQDSRFTSGLRDQIAYANSKDGGVTWSAPARVNANIAVAAFVPSVAVRSDGTIGVSYYDFRSNTADPATLLTDYWLARSRDGITWSESRLSSAFDLASAPVSGTAGYFLGDYQALIGVGNILMPIFVRANDGNLNNRTDVFTSRADVNATTAASFVAAKAAPGIVDALRADTALRQRVSDNIRQKLLDRRRLSVAPITP